MNFILIGLIGCIPAQLLIGFYVSRRIRTESNYLLGGRSLGDRPDYLFHWTRRRKIMNRLISLMAAVIIFATLGCSTPYQPLQRGTNQWGFLVGPGGGYASRQIGENEFEVFFGGNGFTSIETVEKYWHRKAKELCGSENYTHTMESKKTDHFPSAKGTVKCGQNP